MIEMEDFYETIMAARGGWLFKPSSTCLSTTIRYYGGERRLVAGGVIRML